MIYRQLRETKAHDVGVVYRELPQTSSVCDPERYILEKEGVIRDYSGCSYYSNHSP